MDRACLLLRLGLIGIVIPRSCIAGINDLTIGFAASVLGTCIAYVVGRRAAARSSGSCDRASS